MKTANQLFLFEAGPPGGPLVEKIWRTRSVPVERFISVAESHWEIVVTSLGGKSIFPEDGRPAVQARLVGHGEHRRPGLHLPAGRRLASVVSGRAL